MPCDFTKSVQEKDFGLINSRKRTYINKVYQ